MELKEFLHDNPIINKSQFAKEMWGIDTASQKLNNKLAEVSNKQGSVQRITEKDEKRAKEVLAGLAKRILEYIQE